MELADRYLEDHCLEDCSSVFHYLLQGRHLEGHHLEDHFLFLEVRCFCLEDRCVEGCHGLDDRWLEGHRSGNHHLKGHHFEHGRLEDRRFEG